MSNHPHHLHADTLAITAGRADVDGALGSVLWASTAFEVDGLEAMQGKATGMRQDRFYTRYANPTVAAFEDAMAQLEGAEAALAFSSGMGAVSTLILALCSSGDHIVAQHQGYSATQLFLRGPCQRLGIDVTFVDATVPGAFAGAVRPGRTMLVLAETPANPQLAITDLDELGRIEGPFTVVDSTFATPMCQRPLDHGVDVVLHSATKGIAGHNDAMLGVLCGAADLLDAVWSYGILHGACAAPFDAMNGLRGVRTLPVRVERQSATAMRLAEWLEERPEVASVRYPHLPSHPQHELAKRQMTLGGTMVAFDLAGGREAGARVLERLAVVRTAATLGGPETLAVCPAASTHVNLRDDELAAAGITPGLVRLSVGLEHLDDLVADLAQALDGAPA